MDIGFRLQPFNYKMREKRLQMGLTQKELAIQANTRVEVITEAELLKTPTGRSLQNFFDALNRIAQCLETPFDELFPEEYIDACRIKKGLLDKPIYARREMPLTAIRAVQGASYGLIEGDLAPTLQRLQQAELKADLETILQSLTPRQQQIIKMRFGWDGEESKTLEEVGNALKLTRERIRQEEWEAVTKIRRSPRARRILQAHL